MGITDELEEIAGPTLELFSLERMSQKKKNRVVDGVSERFCRECETWKLVEEFHKKKQININRTIICFQHKCKICNNNQLKNIKQKKEMK